MAKFSYTALDAKGRETQGEIEADNQTSALSKIREKGLFPTQVADAAAKPAKKKATKGAGGMMKMELRMPAFLSRVKTKQLMVWTRQLATLVNAGLPLLRGLRVLTKQEKNPLLKRTVSEMAESIESGSTFAEALAQHPRIFNKLFVNMVKAGEVGGVLDVVLLRLAEFMEKAQKIKSKVVSAMVYPVVVLIMAGSILTFLMIFIVPKFQDIFADLLEGEQLPGLTRMVLSVSKTMTSRLPIVVGIVVILVVLAKILAKARFGRLVMDNLKLKMPIFGTLVRKTAIARFTRTLGTLMTSGVPVLQALNIVRDTVQNEVISKAVGLIHDSVKEGENMTRPIEACGVFPPMVVSMVEVGEETGGLPEMLMKIADSYDDDVDNTVVGLTSIIEPILIIFLAIIVGTIVIALFLPLISIIGKMS
ncbi:MAG TPA: type II secretion system F family protein [Kiritimatiellia bacterium]|nr:type II secretion system F family protein [Kiritimatiellia bacterium]HRZ13233.1 type II secretion system F family protein [Kiritimatiellia bacterium]HSA18682.1 type II secretion system F family protein [Kiritimatiellia bacterium]